MRRFILYTLAVLCTLVYLYIRDENITVSQPELVKAADSTRIQQMEASLADIRQSITVPVETRKSYLLDEEKIEALKNLPSQVKEEEDDTQVQE